MMNEDRNQAKAVCDLDNNVLFSRLIPTRMFGNQECESSLHFRQSFYMSILNYHQLLLRFQSLNSYEFGTW